MAVKLGNELLTWKRKKLGLNNFDNTIVTMKEITLPAIHTSQFILRYLDENEWVKALAYFEDNKDRLAVSMPRFTDDFFTQDYWIKRLASNRDEFEDKTSIRFFLMNPMKDKVIGTCNFTDFIGGVYQGAFLGYGIDRNFEGRGIMTDALKVAIEYVFESTNLHKINANYMPSNPASGRVLQKLGFQEIGLAKKELYLGGQWRDHIETRLINTNWKNNFDY